MSPDRVPAIASLGFAAMVVACGGGSAAPQAPPAPAAGTQRVTSLTIVAEDLAYAPEAMSAPAGSRLDVRFENRDPGIPHDLALFSEAGLDMKLFGSAITTGVSGRDLSIPGLVAGTYEFRCFVHPEMSATLAVGS